MRFIPKLQDRTFLTESIEEFFVDADVIINSRKVFDEAKNLIPIYTINPATNRFPFITTESSKKLPYYFDSSDYQKILDDSSFRVKTLTGPCIDFQINGGSSKVIPPYFYVEDLTSQTFNVNIEMISNVIKYKQKTGFSQPIYPVINISSNLLKDDNSIRYIVGSYNPKEFESEVEGYYLLIDNCDASRIEVGILEGLIKLINALAQKKVYLVNINAFGYLALIAGAEGVISGLATSESQSVENWKVANNNSRNRKKEYTYTPNIFSYINEVELKNMGYKCNCAQCKGSLPHLAREKKLHFLACRNSDIERLSHGNKNQRLATLERMLTEGRDFLIKHTATRAITRKGLIEPIQRWIELIPVISDVSNQKEAEEMLNELLKELNS